MRLASSASWLLSRSPGAGIAVQAEEAAQVQVALDGGLQAVECDAAGGGVVGDRAGQAGREGVQDVFAGVGGPVLAEPTGGSSVCTVNGSVRVVSSWPAP